MTLQEAQVLLVSGRYSELLRGALEEQRKAVDERRGDDEFRWTLFVAKACRFIGRTNEAIVHANHALQRVRESPSPESEAEALSVLAVSFKCARRYDECLSMLAKAASLLPNEDSQLLKASIHLETAEAALEAGQRREAESALSRGGAIVNSLGEPRLLAWTLYLRSQVEEVSPADLQLTAAYELARSVDCPELQWQILWKLSERAGQYGREKMCNDFLTRAIEVLSRLAEPINSSDATPFWRQSVRRQFVEQIQKRYGRQFLQKVMLEGPVEPGKTPGLLRDMGWDPSLIPDYIRTRLASQVQWPE